MLVASLHWGPNWGYEVSPEEQRFAADVDGSDPGTYPGIYGVFPLTLSIPGPDAGR